MKLRQKELMKERGEEMIEIQYSCRKVYKISTEFILSGLAFLQPSFGPLLLWRNHSLLCSDVWIVGEDQSELLSVVRVQCVMYLHLHCYTSKHGLQP